MHHQIQEHLDELECRVAAGQLRGWADLWAQGWVIPAPDDLEAREGSAAKYLARNTMEVQDGYLGLLRRHPRARGVVANLVRRELVCAHPYKMVWPGGMPDHVECSRDDAEAYGPNYKLAYVRDVRALLEREGLW